MNNQPEDTIDLNGIAIIGMSGRFPGAKDITSFWENIINKKESIKFFTNEELLAASIPPNLVKDPFYVKANFVLDDIDMFDADFFSFTPKEAQFTDPQQRFFLECAWEALENAGYNPDVYSGLIGVYGGASGDNTYYWRHIFNNTALRESIGDFHLNIGNDRDFLTTRISYKLNLKGPSLNIQTACSTSLVSIIIACQNLLTFQCDMALAGGVSIRLPQQAGYLYKEGMILSPDGHCRPFDRDANGTVFGNGVGMLLLKRLEDAVNDKDHIYAVIKGFSLNNDGSGKVGYTAPSLEGQEEVIAAALAMADIKPETVSLVEAHGTATALGDPIEFAALTNAFQRENPHKQYCALGSCKGNVGHLDVAAGVTGVIKTALALKNKKLPPIINFKLPNAQIDFANSPFFVNTELNDWDTQQYPRRAGVSSFGVGGTNAHIVLEEAPEILSKTDAEEKSWELLLLSAKTPSALQAQAKQLKEHLEKHSELALKNIAFTLQVGRKAFTQRNYIVCEDKDDAITDLQKKCY